MRRVRARRATLALAVAAAGCGGERDPAAPAAAAPARDPVRVLLVTLDTVRADRLGCYGHAAARTPFFDAMAAGGVRFVRAWCAAPITLPSHATLLTGLWPTSHGVRDNGLFALSPRARTLAEALQEERVATGAFVGSFVLDARFGLAQGFDVYSGPEARGVGLDPELIERPAAAVVDDALRWIDRLPAGGAFFLWIHFYDPHAPYQPPAPFDREPADPYDGEIAACDAELARLRRRLEERGLDRGLLEIVTSDHGEAFGEHGEETHGLLLHDATMRVPLLVRGPGVAAGGVVSAPVTLAQVPATVLARIGNARVALPDARLPPLPLRPEEEEPEPAPLLLESLLPFHVHRWHPLQAVVHGRHKLVRGAHDELFDLEADPGERDDLATREPGLAAALARRLAALITDHPPLGWHERTTLSAEERRRLLEMGYAAGEADGAGIAPDAALPDPRGALGAEHDQRRARALLKEGRALLGQDDWFERRAASSRTEETRRRGAELLEQARTLLQALVESYPLDPSFAFDLGHVLIAAGRPADAVAHLETAVLADPSNPFAHYNLAIALAGAGEPELAIAEMEKVVHCEPRFPLAWRWLVMTHDQRGELGRAVWWADRVEGAGVLDPAEAAPMRAMRERLRERMRGAGQEPTPAPGFPPEDLRPESVVRRAAARPDGAR